LPDIFEKKRKPGQQAQGEPLAERMRPTTFEEYVGQQDIIGEGKPLRTILAGESIPSIILWGPPGTGKTTLARLIARATSLEFVSFSAVTSGVKDVKQVVEQARYRRQSSGRGTILFVDEIHRFNKAQQDAFLPHVEDGTIVLIGATTENPSFEVISPLLSRCRVFVLRHLTADETKTILRRAMADGERGLGRTPVNCPEEALDYIANIANGDARTGLNLLELAVHSASFADGVKQITKQQVADAAQRKFTLYDKTGEEHYNIISAFHKSLRGSDVNATLYWLARMLESGEDPLFVARRMVRAASEDIGNADPQALAVALAAKDAVDFVGLPEANLALAQAAIYLATAPKSNAVYKAFLAVRKDVQGNMNMPVPLHLRNAVTDLMEELDYGKGYLYPHDSPGHFVKQQYLPDNLQGREYYHPSDFGFEKEIRKRMEWWKRRGQEDS
jgi:putative ATPase